MCTVLSSDRRGRGWGVGMVVCPQRGVSAQGDVCWGVSSQERRVSARGCVPEGVSARGCVCPSACRDTPPPLLTEIQTLVKILPYRNYVADGKY